MPTDILTTEKLLHETPEELKARRAPSRTPTRSLQSYFAK